MQDMTVLVNRALGYEVINVIVVVNVSIEIVLNVDVIVHSW